MNARDWDAPVYDRIADPMTRWGTSVLERLPLAGAERVLDAGCGSGRVTERLLDRLPQGRVVALDAAPGMIEEARRRLARFGDRVEFVTADLARPLSIEPVDAILSTATFHWIADHDRLFANLAAVLPRGGWLVAQCGGTGNLARIYGAAAELGDPEQPNFQDPETTRRRLEAAGFIDVETWLNPEPTRVPTDDVGLYLRAIILRSHLARRTPAEANRFLAGIMDRMPDGTFDYVRLNIVARRA